MNLKPNASIEFETKEMVFIYLISGEIILEEKKVSSSSLINFEKQGNKISVKTLDKSANFIFASGTPHNEAIVTSGPFVMTTKDQMQETKLRLQNGEMGVLNHL